MGVEGCEAEGHQNGDTLEARANAHEHAHADGMAEIDQLHAPA